MNLNKLSVFCVLLILSNISLADIEDEVHSPEYEEISNNKNSEDLQNLYKNYNFKNLITCIFKKDEYKEMVGKDFQYYPLLGDREPPLNYRN